MCVAGFISPKNDILELRLPPKLFADENKGLCAERDFRVVHGGFTDSPVRCLRHIPGTRCVVTSDGFSSELQVWDLGGDDSDVIRRTGSVKTTRRRKSGASERGSKMAARLATQPQLLHGAASDDVQLTELSSGRTLFTLDTDSADPLSSLHFLSDAVFLACCSNGNVFTADTRTPAPPLLLPPPPGESAPWWTDAAAGGCRTVRVSSSGLAVVSDLRNAGGGVAGRAQLDVQSGRSRLDDITVSWAPALDDCIAVSGFGGAVQVYDTSVWSTEPQDARPLFQHRGHAVSAESQVQVTSHVWHPERPRTLLSAASDGSVHLWDWVDQSADG